MTPSSSRDYAKPTSDYRRRIAYSAKVFSITLRLAGIILLVVQIVQAVMKIAADGGISTNIVVGCVLAVLLIWAGRRTAVESAMTKFASATLGASSNLYIYGVPFLLVAIVLWAKLQIGPNNDAWRYVSSEGSLSEYGTAIAYLLVPVFGYHMIKRFAQQNRKLMTWLYGAFVAGALFVGMEEISWGQRILGFEEPEFISRHNVQSEFTLHNLSFYQNHLLKPVFILVGFIGSSCWIVLRYWQARRRQAMSRLDETTASTAGNARPKLELGYFFPDWPISSFFYPVLIFGVLADYTAYGRWLEFHAAADHEHWEFIMGLGVLLFVVVNFFRQARADDLLAQDRADASAESIDQPIS